MMHPSARYFGRIDHEIIVIGGLHAHVYVSSDLKWRHKPATINPRIRASCRNVSATLHSVETWTDDPSTDRPAGSVSHPVCEDIRHSVSDPILQPRLMGLRAPPSRATSDSRAFVFWWKGLRLNEFFRGTRIPKSSPRSDTTTFAEMASIAEILSTLRSQQVKFQCVVSQSPIAEPISLRQAHSAPASSRHGASLHGFLHSSE